MSEKQQKHINDEKSKILILMVDQLSGALFTHRPQRINTNFEKRVKSVKPKVSQRGNEQRKIFFFLCKRVAGAP